MSYDLRIYSVQPFRPEMLHGRPGWQAAGQDSGAIRTSQWQIVINSSDRILPEDVEEEVAALLPGIGYLTELNLEGQRHEEAQRRLRSTAREIAKAMHGVVVDPQDDTLVMPSGVKRFIPPKREEGFSVTQLSWWFLTDVLHDRAGLDGFITLLERLLPEALPKRYGEYEPPQHIYAETGRSHLLRFIQRNLDTMMAWYPNRPVAHVHLACPQPLGAGPQGFRTNLVEIEVETAILHQPGWVEQLRRLWRQLSRHLCPIYGDIRTEGGRTRHGGTTYITPDALRHDEQITRSWFWRGIPLRLGQAVVLGEVYQRLWPEFAAHAEVVDGLAFASVADWSSAEDVSMQVGRAPKALALRPGEGMGQKQKYPDVWPFGPPFLARK